MEKRSALRAGLSVFIVSLIVYAFTLCPVVWVGDSGEFTTSAYLLGISHPPGYPLYSILGKLFTLIPSGTVAARVNFSSTVFASLTAMLVYLLVLTLTSNIPVSVTAALTLSFSRTFWSQAVTSEVYALNAFFTALCLLILLVWENKGEDRFLYLFAFIYGLSLANHYIMMLFLPAFFYFIVSSSPGRRGFVRRFAVMALFFLMGLAVYLYLPLRSLKNPPLDWGNPENLRNFILHLKRVQYRAFEFGKKSALSTRISFTGNFVSQALAQFGFLLTCMALLGIWFLYRKGRIRFLATTVLIFIADSLGLIFLLNFEYTVLGRAIVEVYYLPAYILMAVWMGYALERSAAGLIKSVPARKACMAALTALVPAILLLHNFKENDRSTCYVGYDYGMDILNTMERDGVYFAFGDNQLFVLSYLRYVEKIRTDITVYDTSNRIFFPRLYGEEYAGLTEEGQRSVRRETYRKIIENDARPVYFSQRENNTEFGYESVPQGLLLRVLRKGGGYAPARNYWTGYRLRGIDENRRTGEYWIKDIVSEYYYYLGNYYIERGEKEEGLAAYRKAAGIGYDIDWLHNNLSVVYERLFMLDDAERESRLTLALNPDSADAYNNFGIVCFRKGRIDEAAKSFKKALEINPSLSHAQYNYDTVINLPR